MTDFDVSMKTLVKHGLKFDAYLILHCLQKKNFDLISAYVSNCGAINTSIFNELEKQGYLKIDSQGGDIFFEHLFLTDKGKQLFTSIDVDKLFGEFREFYPKSTPRGRRLHGNLKRCKVLYAKLLEEVSHDVLCKCAKLYHEEKIRTNSQEYVQGLDVWLNQRNYEQYVEDIGKERGDTAFTDDI